MKKFLTAALLSTASITATAETVASHALSVNTALELVKEGLAACAKDNYHVSVAIVDHSGNLKAFGRHNKSGPHAAEGAKRKAFSAASMEESTEFFFKLIQKNPELQGLHALHDNILILPGGLPIKYKGEVIAGIGVSGAPGGDLDTACAEAAISKVLNK
ncbi:heme-binding protein [Endozoicomonas sp. SM1973]|uniref:Heme-binding protein n=1 Tax=Spartinivicinus marinus TaxID=2994442 RepID=A0A853I0C0_9GAMM|nr:heme-binding protein [Spartinivicinus marinus]MCX4029934.1 heme-binding protein [Spartinivicinus marinus]NYZ64822.1 heme-binding protein [Spartinivicinus marinus]